MSQKSNKCDDIKIKNCADKKQTCNPKTGYCINKKKIIEFIKELKTYKKAIEVIEGYNIDDDKVINELSKQGFIYEKIWDICIKLGITDLTNKKTTHGIGNVNNKNDAVFKTIDKFFVKYIDEGIISGNSGGYSDITFENEKEDKKILYLVSVKYIKGNNIKDFDIQNLCTIIKDREEEYIKKNKDDKDMKNYEIKTLLFVKNKKDFIERICIKANKSSNLLIKYISPNGNYENVYDLVDLEIYYNKLRKLLELYDYWKDEQTIKDFKEGYLAIKDIKIPFIPRFHQELFIEKINAMINTFSNKDDKKILVGAIPRSGKTYIMAGTILRHVKEHTRKELKNRVTKRTFNNYVIITPAPNETLKQYEDAFNEHIDFDRYNIKAKTINISDKIDFNRHNDDTTTLKRSENHIVYLISKQRLENISGRANIDNEDEEDEIKGRERADKYKENIENYFGKEDNNIKIIFMDEAHFGMSTAIAKEIVDTMNTNKSIKIFVTATYNKPQNIYHVKEKNLIKWDLDDIDMIKSISYKNFREVIKHFSKKFSKNILKKVLKNNGWNWGNSEDDKITTKVFNNNKHIIDNIIKQYMHFPQPYMITAVWDKEFYDKEKEKLLDTEGNILKDYGFDMGKLFEPNKSNNSFVNEEQLVQLLHYYFGYPDTDKKYDIQYQYKMNGILPRIERICNHKCRTLQTKSHKTTQLWFLPHDHIAKIINALLHLLSGSKFKYIFKKYVFYIAVDIRGIKDTDKYKDEDEDHIRYMGKAGDIKKDIKDIEKEIKDTNNYEGLIILTGKRLQLGISLENVDIVALFTNINASDAIYQMIFRSMTEVDNDDVCDGSSFCSKKKYGFMVDLNPQRTIYTLEYFADRITNKGDKDDREDKEDRFNSISKLINIDKDKLTNKDDNATDAENIKFTKEFFDKLTSSWEANTENIKNILIKQDIFSDDVKTILKENEKFDFSRLFKNDKTAGKALAVKPDLAFVLKNIYTLQPKKGKKEVKEPNVIDIWIDILSETISILSFISSYYKNEFECIFVDDKRKDFNYEILKIFEELNDDKELKVMFIYFLKKRVIKKEAIGGDEDNFDKNLFDMIYDIIKLINKKHPTRSSKQSGGQVISVNEIIHMRKQKIYNIKKIDELLEFINANLAPKEVEKKERGEVFTPMKLVNEMLDKLPQEVWSDEKKKWLDPATGMGNFPVAVYIRLMEGLKKRIGNEEERRRHILQNMLYMVELDKGNVFMLKKIFCGKGGGGGTYKLNIFEGSFIDFKTATIVLPPKEEIDIKFDVILGNPPFQYKEGDTQAQPIWHLFVERSYELLENNGYLLIIHPSGWRDISGKGKGKKRNVFDFMKEHNLIYLNMNDFETGKKIFGVGTNFDYYVVQNTLTNSNKTIINDIDNTKGDEEEYEIDLNNWDFIPSGKFKDFKKIIATKKEEKVNVLNESLYHTQRDEMTDTKTEFPCCYSITIKDAMKYKYSRRDKGGHFGVPKVIWSNGAGTYPIVDKEGKYGLTQYCYAIIDDTKNLNAIKKAMDNPEFIKLMKYLSFKEDHKYNYKIISLFKKDFYNYFLDKKLSGGMQGKKYIRKIAKVYNKSTIYLDRHHRA
jgi:hypothetical protein